MNRRTKAFRVAGLGGCLPSLVLAISATTSSINYNLAAAFLSLAFGIFGVIGLISAMAVSKAEQRGEPNE